MILSENLYDDVREWKLVETKPVEDEDGFETEYAWYTDGEKHIFMFGDTDLYEPDELYADHEADSEEEAREWFDNYSGFNECLHEGKMSELSAEIDTAGSKEDLLKDLSSRYGEVKRKLRAKHIADDTRKKLEAEKEELQAKLGVLAYKKPTVDINESLSKMADEAVEAVDPSYAQASRDMEKFQDHFEDVQEEKKKEAKEAGITESLEDEEEEEEVKETDDNFSQLDSVYYFEPWEGAVHTYEKIKDAHKLAELESLVDELYPEGLTVQDFNDLLWFEDDWVLSMLNLSEEE